MNELNKKLAEWRWPGAQVYIPSMRHPGVGDEIRVRIDEQTTCYEFFTSSLDDCFKWLVPKLEEKHFCVMLDRGMLEKYWVALKHTSQVIHDHNYWEEAETPALALCLAIEKLIDAKGK